MTLQQQSQIRDSAFMHQTHCSHALGTHRKALSETDILLEIPTPPLITCPCRPVSSSDRVDPTTPNGGWPTSVNSVTFLKRRNLLQHESAVNMTELDSIYIDISEFQHSPPEPTSTSSNNGIFDMDAEQRNKETERASPAGRPFLSG